MENFDKNTGLVETEELNKVIHIHSFRQNGTLRIQQDFRNCPTMAEQHTAHLTDINYLIAKYRPDELAAYLAARQQFRQEIIGHDFSSEPSLQEAKNVQYQLKEAFNDLPDEIRNNFKNHVEFLKFIDNPANAEKMIKLGLMTKKEVEKHTDPQTQNNDLNDDKTKKDQTKKPPKTVPES